MTSPTRPGPILPVTLPCLPITVSPAQHGARSLSPAPIGHRTRRDQTVAIAGHGRFRSARSYARRAICSASTRVAPGPYSVTVARYPCERSTTYHVLTREDPLTVATPTVREPSPSRPRVASTT